MKTLLHPPFRREVTSLPLATFFARGKPGRRPRSARTLRSWILALALVSAVACAVPRGGQEDAGIAPVLLMAVDGLEWSLLLPMLQAGELPEMARLMDAGTYGFLSTSRPTFSPIIWTSIATGRPPAEHGIRGFVRRRGADRRLFNGYDRKTKAFWNILSDHGRRVASVGWWMTYPVETVNGVMVAQVNTVDQTRRKGGRAILKGGLVEDLEGQVFPPERLEEFLAIHREVVETLPQRMSSTFGFSEPRAVLARRLWDNSAWSLRSDATYLEIAERLATEGFDLLACYLGGTDVVAHRFWRYMEPAAFDHPPSAADVERFGDAIRDYYRFVDRSIGRLKARLPAEARVLVISDHGMHATNTSQEFDSDALPEDLNSAHHHGAPPGVLLAAGLGIASEGPGADWRSLRPDELVEKGSILDVLPTLLTLLEVPLARDLRGRPLAALGEPSAEAPVASYEDEAWRAARRSLRAERLQSAGDEERIEQLKALGYIQ